MALELDLNLTANEALDRCAERGLFVRSEGTLGGKPSGRHWHLGLAGRPGTLELSERQNRVWLKVHARRDGGWASALAHELASSQAADASSNRV